MIPGKRVGRSDMMRVVYSILIVLMLGGIFAAGAWRAHTERQSDVLIEQTRNELQRFQRQIAVRAALRDVPVSDRGYPLTIERHWFDGRLPRNVLVSVSQPWLEIAGEDQADYRHPPDPIVVNRNQAMFWYNPFTGRVRARVPAQASESASMDLYNSVNGTTVSAW